MNNLCEKSANFFFVKGVIVNVLDFVAIESQSQLLMSFVLVEKLP